MTHHNHSICQNNQKFFLHIQPYSETKEIKKFFSLTKKVVYTAGYKILEIGDGGWIATEEAVTDSDCAGDGRQQQSLYYRFFNKSITAA